jgi:alpha-methylacyl-CoA racemase
VRRRLLITWLFSGSIEPQFYSLLVKGLGLDQSKLPAQQDTYHWEETKKMFTSIFASKTQEHWISVFKDVDACVTPVLDFTVEEGAKEGYAANPKPAPALSRTPALQTPKGTTLLEPGSHTNEILKEFGLTNDEIKALIQKGAVKANDIKSSL